MREPVRALVQRDSRAEVRVADEVVGRIGVGLLVLVGAGQGDVGRCRSERPPADRRWLGARIIAVLPSLVVAARVGLTMDGAL